MKRSVIIVIGIVVAVPVFLVLLFVVFWVATQKRSKIIDFHPENFVAHASKPFFYSVGNSLKYGDVIIDDGSKLSSIKEWVKNPVVSPDGAMLAFVDGEQL